MEHLALAKVYAFQPFKCNIGNSVFPRCTQILVLIFERPDMRQVGYLSLKQTSVDLSAWQVDYKQISILFFSVYRKLLGTVMFMPTLKVKRKSVVLDVCLFLMYCRAYSCSCALLLKQIETFLQKS